MRDLIKIPFQALHPMEIIGRVISFNLPYWENKNCKGNGNNNSPLDTKTTPKLRPSFQILFNIIPLISKGSLSIKF